MKRLSEFQYRLALEAKSWLFPLWQIFSKGFNSNTPSKAPKKNCVFYSVHLPARTYNGGHWLLPLDSRLLHSLRSLRNQQTSGVFCDC